MSEVSVTESLEGLQSRLGASDEDAFEALFDRFGTPIFRFISGMVGDTPLAHDLTQETFAQLWEGRDRVNDVDSLQAYIFRIARNRVYDHRRAERRRRSRRAERSKELSAGPPERPDGEVRARALHAKFREWIEDLPERQREALLLSREQGMSHEEIAQVMDISPNTVNNHIVKAMATLRDRVDQYRPDLL
ncbi:MAG: RNA polymerase sigma factor [Salinibacter sp.]